MLPLNYAILELFKSGDEYDTEAVMGKLQGDYGSFRSFSAPAVLESLMSAEKNELLEESRFDLDTQGNLHVYYRATDYGQSMIERYIG
jgi:DNA-binding PadR family transcriptional regulator